MSSKGRLLKEKIMVAITCLASITIALILVVIIGTIAIRALPALSVNLIINDEYTMGGINKAIGQDILGTIYLSVLSVAIATPLAVGTAVYLRKYATDNILTRVIRLLIEVFSGTPSIVIGVFGLIFIAYYLMPITGGWSLLTGSLALGILVLPVIIRSTEEAIAVVPKELEDASYAMGATKWKTISKITLPFAMTGIFTGVVLGVGRAAEESAVVLLTAGYSQYWPRYTVFHSTKYLFGIQLLPFQTPIGTLPIAIYNVFNSPTIPSMYGFADALILILAVLLINLCARLIAWQWRIRSGQAKASGLSDLWDMLNNIHIKMEKIIKTH